MEDKKLLTAVLAAAGLLATGVTLHQLMQLIRRRRRSKKGRSEEEIQVVCTHQQWDQQLHTILQHINTLKVLGLDCEWTMDQTLNQRRPVALLQMATPFGLCVLVRLSHFTHIPQSLKDLLADDSILKTGVAVCEDGKKLAKDYGMSVRGCVDLRNMMMRVRHNYECDLSLQGLAGGILGVNLDKRREVRCSDWEADEFTPEQISYAAADGQVGVDIFLKLALTKLMGRDPGDQVWSLEQVDLKQLWKIARAMCQGIVDVGFKETRASGHTQVSQAKQPSKKSDEKVNPYTARAYPLYHNCQLQAPDGQPLCTCNSKKAEWYIERELGDKVCDDPLTVRLRFEPAGRPTNSEDDFYVQEKQNMCVVCGRTDNYSRKFIVPQDYRRYFPRVLKDHRSHDVLLMCSACHRVSSSHDAVLREQVAEECDAPIDVDPDIKNDENQRKRVRSAAKTLKQRRGTIPESRVREMEKEILDYLGEELVTEQVLDRCLNMEPRVSSSEYPPHGKKVVDYFSQRGQLWEFKKRWRQHFVQTMKPQHLPPLWSIEHHHNGVVSTY